MLPPDPRIEPLPLTPPLPPHPRPPARPRRSGGHWLDASATALLQHMRPAQVAPAVRMLRGIDEAEDPVGAINALLQVGGARAERKLLVQGVWLGE